jgi:transcriptional regulator with XRE-family HTH domain
MWMCTVADGALTSYGELADVLASLPLLLRAERRRRQLSCRAAAEELGMSFATVHRIESGKDGALSNAAKVLRWLEAGGADHG